jgi:small-conductance mechanosensitive channel
MPASEFQKRAFYFLIVAGTITIIFLAMPFVEGWIYNNLLPQFGLRVEPDGKLATLGGGTPSMMAETSVHLVENVIHVIRILLWMILVISVVRFLSFLILKTFLRASAQSEIASLLKSVLSIIIYIVAYFVIFQSQYPNVQLAPLFTGSAILGIVVGLALQDTLGNLFAGVALQADQPFQVGDVISITNRGSGVVESVSWRGVKIRTFQNKLLVISNSVLGKETIEIAPRGNLNARTVNFSTLYSNSPAKTVQVVREAVRQVENVSAKIRPVVRIRNLGESGIEWEVKYWLDDYTKHNDTDALIRQRLWYACLREKIDFAYPTRVVHVLPKEHETTIDEQVNSIVERLAGISIFAPLSGDETERLAATARVRVYAPGEAIVRIGQEGNSMFVINRGSVKVQIPDGSSQRTINELHENDFFGEMSLLTGQPRTATVIAAEETEVLQIRKTAIKPIFEANPKLVSAISEIIGERREALKQVEESVQVTQHEQGRGLINSIRKFFGLGVG